MTSAAASRGKSEPLNRNEMRAMRRYALDYLRPSQQRFLAPRSLVVLRFAVCSRKSLPTDAPDGPDFPPPPPPLLFCHDWIPGVALRGTLAQTDRPYGKGLGWAMPASISCSCLWLLVASNRPHKGLSPSVIHPCPTHLGSLALASVRHAPGPDRGDQIGAATCARAGGADRAQSYRRHSAGDERAGGEIRRGRHQAQDRPALATARGGAY